MALGCEATSTKGPELPRVQPPTPVPSTAGALQHGVLALGALAALLIALAVLWWRAAVRPVHRPGDPAGGSSRATATAVERVHTFVMARLSARGYLGLHLTVGLAVSAAALLLFGKVVDDLLERDDLALLDATVAAWLTSVRTPGGLRFFAAVTEAGNPAVIAVVGVLAAGMLVVRRHWLLLAGLAASFAGGALFVEGVKLAFHRARPSGAMTYLHRYSWSYPSGHAAGVVFGFGFVAYLLVLWAAQRWARVLIGTIALCVVVAVAASRLYLGVHYFTDVVGGLAVGAAWLGVCVSGVEALRRRPA